MLWNLAPIIHSILILAMILTSKEFHWGGCQRLQGPGLVTGYGRATITYMGQRKFNVGDYNLNCGEFLNRLVKLLIQRKIKR